MPANLLAAFDSCSAFQHILSLNEGGRRSAFLPDLQQRPLEPFLSLQCIVISEEIELNMACHTIAAHFGASEIERRELRAFAACEVKETNGQISFDHALEPYGTSNPVPVFALRGATRKGSTDGTGFWLTAWRYILI